jgi:SAM-dependent methyltransferase
MTQTTHRLQRWLSPLAMTPLHPQWLVLRHRREAKDWVNRYARGTLLDIGCGNGQLRKQLSEKIRYVGVDYPKTIAMGYTGHPDIFADATKLPLTDSCVDTVVLLDVLEHLREPEDAIAEIVRILNKEGKCLIHVPFLYPLHDIPNDYQRWTKYGLMQLLDKHGLRIIEISETTSSVETAAAMLAISLAKGWLDSVKARRIGFLLIPIVVTMIPFVNVAGWLMGKLLLDSRFMPFSYRLVASLK